MKSLNHVVLAAAVAVIASNGAFAEEPFSVSDGGTAKGNKTHTIDASPVVCESVATVNGREPSLLPKGRKFSLVWHDEFDGDALDASKWGWRTNFWGRSAHWFATPEDSAHEVKDGLLHLKLVKRPDGQFVSPQLQTGEIVWVPGASPLSIPF